MPVRIETQTAVFIAVWQVHKRTAAAVSQNVQRAIAEQAVEIIRISLWMAGKVFTLPVAEIRKMFTVKIFFHCQSPIPMQKNRYKKSCSHDGTACNFNVMQDKIIKSLFAAGLCIHQAGLLTRIIAVPAFPTFVSGICGWAPHYSDGIVPESHRNSLLACFIRV